MSGGDPKTLLDDLCADYKARKVKIRDVDVWVTPMSLAESANVQAKFPDDTAKRQAEILIMKCRTETGEAIFTAPDARDRLATQVNGNAFQDAWTAINGRSVEDQAEK